MNPIIIAVIIVGAIGLIVGVVLAVASVLMAVPKDEKAEAIAAVLPGANCGACGFSGCSGYAAALAKGTAQPGLCSPGGEAAAKAVAALLGQEAAAVEKTAALVHCMGSCDNTDTKENYQGITSCKAATVISGGTGKCSFGCVGFGDCAAVCEYNAIKICNGVAVVDQNNCKSCKKCVSACPKHIISIVPVKKTAVVRCSNHDKGAQTRKACTIGCIGCMRCTKVCETGAIKVENFCATVDQSLCTGCGACVAECKQGCITM